VESFVQKHGPRVMGVLSGFDRLVFRGKIRQLAHVSGVDCYLAVMGVLLKDFGKHAQALGQKLKAAVTARVQGLGRPVLYLPASSVKQPGARTARDDSPVELQAECHRQNAQPARERWQQACRACPCVGCEGYRTEYRGQRTKDDTSRVPRPYDCAEGAAGLTRIGPGASGVTPNSRASQPGATGGLPMRFAFEGEARGRVCHPGSRDQGSLSSWRCSEFGNPRDGSAMSRRTRRARRSLGSRCRADPPLPIPVTARTCNTSPCSRLAFPHSRVLRRNRSRGPFRRPSPSVECSSPC